MIFVNNFIPIRIYYSEKLNLYRLETCRADKDTMEFSSKIPASYKLQTILYGLNPRIFPPVPLGSSMFSIYQNDKEPFETRKVEWIAFPIMTTVATEIGDFSVFAFITNPGKDSNAVPVFIRNEENDVKITFDEKLIADYFLKTPYDQKALDRDNFVIYLFKEPCLYWRGTSEALCVPSINPNHFPTLIDCQRETYGHLKNHKSYTGNSAKPLSWMKSRVFVQEKKPKQGKGLLIFTILFLCLILLLISLKWMKSKNK